MELSIISTLRPHPKFTNGKIEEIGAGSIEYQFAVYVRANFPITSYEWGFDHNGRIVPGVSPSVNIPMNVERNDFDPPDTGFKLKGIGHSGGLITMAVKINNKETFNFQVTTEQLIQNKDNLEALAVEFDLSGEIPEPVDPDPVPDGIAGYLVVTFIRGMYLIAGLISMLWFKNLFKVFTHVQLGWLSSKFDLSAEGKGVMFVDRDISRKKARSWFAVKIPLTQAQVDLVTKVINGFVDDPEKVKFKYDYYFYFRRALNVFLILTIPYFLYSLIFWNLVPMGVIAFLYGPLNWWLWKRSQKTWACSELTASVLFVLDIDFGYTKFTQSDPDDMKNKFQFAVDNKLNGWEEAL